MTVLGCDISWWQGNMNWQKCYDAGARFAFIRAGSIDNSTGKCYEDYKFARNSSIAPDILPVGYYWYFRPNWSAKLQAEYLAKLLQNAKFNIRPVVDVEAPESTWGKTITPKQYADYVAEFRLTIQTKLGVDNLIYTRAEYWNRLVEKRAWSTTDLWIARYSAYLSSPWSDGKYMPRDWSNWKFWQWTSTGDGYSFGTDVGSKGIDLDYFNGTQDELDLYTGMTTDYKLLWMKSIDLWARSQGYTGISPTGV